MTAEAFELSGDSAPKIMSNVSDQGISEAIRELRCVAQFQMADLPTKRRIVYSTIEFKRSFLAEFVGSDPLEEILARARGKVRGRVNGRGESGIHIVK